MHLLHIDDELELAEMAAEFLTRRDGRPSVDATKFPVCERLLRTPNIEP